MDPKIKDVVRLLNSGADMSVSRSRGGSRRLAFKRKLSATNLNYVLSEERYKALMMELIDWLGEQYRDGVAVEVKMDFHGARWVEMRSGLLGRRRSRIGLSARYIDMLATQLGAAALEAHVEPTAA